MSFTAAEAIRIARFNLDDPDGDRWETARFYPLINEALEHIRRLLIVEPVNEFVILQNNISNYDLSAKVYELRRVEFNNKTLPFLTYNEMDRKYGKDWQSKKGAYVEAIVYDLHKKGEFQTYPIYKDGDANSILQGNTDYEVITDVGASSLPYSIVPEYTSDYGAINLSIKDVLHVFYLPNLTDVDSGTDSINLNIDFIEPVANFISYRALQDNKDTQNLIVAKEYKDSFFNKLAIENRSASESYVSTKHRTPYNGIG